LKFAKIKNFVKKITNWLARIFRRHYANPVSI
jgi:hypothetical protein